MNRGRRLTRITCATLVAVMLAGGGPAGRARADELGYDHPLVWIVWGTLIVDTGVTIANGIALSSGTANPRNGWIGVGAGAVSFALVGLSYVLDDDPRSDFAIVMGAAGGAALTTGILTLRAEGGRGAAESALPRVRIGPCLVRGGGNHIGPGLSMCVRF